MTDVQLYLAIGLPMVSNGLLYNALSARLSSLEARILALGTSVAQRLDLLTGKVAGMDTRLSVLEDLWKRG